MSAVSEALFRTQMETLNAFLKFLPEQYGEDVDMDFMSEVVSAFQKKLEAERGDGVPVVVPVSKTTSKKKNKSTTKSMSDDSDTSSTTKTEKKKRAPSAYNHFIKYKCAILKKEGDIAAKELMMAASSSWKELDEDKKKEFTALLKSNPDISCKELYEQVMGEEHDDITMDDLEAPKKKVAPKKTDKKKTEKAASPHPESESDVESSSKDEDSDSQVQDDSESEPEPEIKEVKKKKVNKKK